jgi:NADH-quinone oxidoreductase subunit N
VEFYYGNISAQLDHLRLSLEWIYPELTLGLMIPVLLLAAMILPKATQKTSLPVIVGMGLLLTAYLLWDQQGFVYGSLQHTWFLNLIRVDTLSVQFRQIGLVAGIGVLLLAVMTQSPEGWKTEFWIFLLTALLGMNLLCLATNWLMVFVSLETLSLSSYLLTGYLRKEGRSAEAGLKYFIFGSVATAAFLYGCSLLYGLTGTLDFSSAEFSSNLLRQPSALPASLGLILIWLGIAFKISAFPMHFWSPDVYEGAPSGAAAYLSTGPKIAAIVLILRILPAFPEGSLSFGLEYLIGFTALISMFLGNTAALRQNDLHRLLAWSGIAHTGYLLAVIGCSTQVKIEALHYYLLVYSVANIGAFACVGLIRKYAAEPNLLLLNGKGTLLGIPAVLLILFFATLAGLPPSAGFFAKIKLFVVLLENYSGSGQALYLALLIGMLINTVVGLYYYVRPVAVLYFGNKPEGSVSVRYGWMVWLLLIPGIWVLLSGVLF